MPGSIPSIMENSPKADFKSNGIARYYDRIKKDGSNVFLPANISGIVPTTGYAHVRFHDGSGYFGPDGCYVLQEEITPGEEFLCVNGINCRLLSIETIITESGKRIYMNLKPGDRYVQIEDVRSQEGDSEYVVWQKIYQKLVHHQMDQKPAFKPLSALLKDDLQKLLGKIHDADDATFVKHRPQISDLLRIMLGLISPGE